MAGDGAAHRQMRRPLRAPERLARLADRLTHRPAVRPLVLGLALAWAVTAAVAVPLSGDARRLLQGVQRSADNGGEPFVIIDKRQARLWLLDGRGEVLAHTPVLLGLARGDHSVPGIGERPLAAIRPHERTTPAGRFVAEAGRNLGGEDIVWIDYDAAVSMHRVRATNPVERRLQRLASPDPQDNRISFGCVNVPAAFYDARIRPLFGRGRHVVYVLPETLPLGRTFGALIGTPAVELQKAAGR